MKLIYIWMCFFCTYMSYLAYDYVDKVLPLPGYLLYVSGMVVFMVFLAGVIFSKKAQCEGHQRKSAP